MNRRRLLAGSAALAAMTLASCATAPLDPGTIAKDVSLIATAYAAIRPSLANLGGLGPANLAKINQAISELQTAAAAFPATGATAAAQPIVMRITADLGAIITATAGLALPPPIGPVLQAASVLLPIIEAAVGLAGSVGAAPGSLTPEQARAILRLAAA